MFWRARIVGVGCGWSRRCTIPSSSGSSSRTWGWPAQGRAPAPRRPRPDRLCEGARTPSCLRGGALSVLIRPGQPSHTPVDGGGVPA